MLEKPLEYQTDQTVTVYNAYGGPGQKQFKRTVLPQSAYYRAARRWQQAETGTVAQTDFVLCLPQGAAGQTFVPPQSFTGAEGTYTLYYGDKVYPGEGPEIADARDWAGFIPAYFDGMGVVRQVDYSFGQYGEITAVEAGA